MAFSFGQAVTVFFVRNAFQPCGLKGGVCSALRLQCVLDAWPPRAPAVADEWRCLRTRLGLVRTYPRRVSPARRCLSRALWCVRAHETLSLWQGRHEQ